LEEPISVVKSLCFIKNMATSEGTKIS
jgi:hypothetical protein